MNWTVERLTNEAKAFLKSEFDLELTIPIGVNGRLSRAMGRFSHENCKERKPVKIELSKKVVDNFPDKHIKDTLYHELIHYALFVKGLPYRDSDKYFIDTCHRLGVSLGYDGEDGYFGTGYRYVCQTPGCLDWETYRKLPRKKKFVCKRCNTDVICEAAV